MQKHHKLLSKYTKYYSASICHMQWTFSQSLNKTYCTHGHTCSFTSFIDLIGSRWSSSEIWISSTTHVLLVPGTRTSFLMTPSRSATNMTSRLSNSRVLTVSTTMCVYLGSIGYSSSDTCWLRHVLGIISGSTYESSHFVSKSQMAKSATKIGKRI